MAAELQREGADAVLLVGASQRLRRELIASGLRPVQWLMHVPDFAHTKIAAPTRGPGFAFACSTLLSFSPLKAAAARALRLPGLSRLPVTSLLLMRYPAAPFGWLAALPPAVDSCAAVGITSGRPGAAGVFLRFSEREPDVVVKIGGRSRLEGDHLGALGPLARAAGVMVPEVQWSGSVRQVPVLAQTPLAGQPAHRALSGDPHAAEKLMQRVGRWLERWNASSSSPRPLSIDDLEQRVLGPARRLAPDVGLEDYLPRLTALCRSCEGRRVPFVAAHNDLTAANLVIAPDGQVGVIDWEESTTSALPLGDLAYALVDAAAAVGDYRDRCAAYESCFSSAGMFSDSARELVEQASRLHGLDDDLRQLCLQACWLHHAGNEQCRDRDDPRRPFLQIARQAAAELR